MAVEVMAVAEVAMMPMPVMTVLRAEVRHARIVLRASLRGRCSQRRCCCECAAE
jgi:hypothetical protein